ncbi:MAG: hypothetical protein ACK40S_01615 [Burkholderiaceae bacterium]
MPTIKITDATVEPLTLAQAKDHLRETLDDAGNDALIASLITVARQAAEDRLQRTLLQTTWEHTRSAFPVGGAPIALPMPRIMAVASVQYRDPAGALQTLPPSAYQLAPGAEPGQLWPTPGTVWPSTQAQHPAAVVVRYTAGYGTQAADVPAPIVQWIKLALTDLYQRRARSSDKPAVPHQFADALLDVHRVLEV